MDDVYPITTFFVKLIIIYIEIVGGVHTIITENKTREFKTQNKIINNSEFYFIAEIGHNHQGKIEKAFELIRKAKEAGANAVKLQKRDNKSLYTRAFYNQIYDNPNSYGETYGKHREALEFNFKQYKELQDYAKSIEIDFFATPFDPESVDFLEKLNMPAYKIASADLTNSLLQEKIAKLSKPIFLNRSICRSKVVSCCCTASIVTGNRRPWDGTSSSLNCVTYLSYSTRSEATC